MRRGLIAAAPDPLQAAVDRELDSRLDRASATPVALALSGGGDSRALLHLAADWCARAHRPLLALTVDHGLDRRSGGWTARAGRMAREAGAGWRALAWTGAKPAAGLPAAARAARHALLAEAAREAGACVLLLAHTADDFAETEAMRAGAAPGIGRLRAWAPSPAWPQGRGVMLLRPLLEVSRHALRAWLAARALDWIEDPANADPRFARARVRLAGAAAVRPSPARPAGFGEASSDGRVRLERGRLDGPGARRSLSAAIACASGSAGAPDGSAVERLLLRLTRPGPVTATAGGAWIVADEATVIVGCELGRAPPPPLALGERAVVWDGRFEAAAPGWSLGAAAGRLARLPAGERAALRGSPPPLRRAHPVFIRGEEVRLAGEGRRLRALAPARLDAALGRLDDEAQVRRASHGGG